MLSIKQRISLIKRAASDALAMLPPWTFVGQAPPRHPDYGEMVNIPASAVQDMIESYYRQTFGSRLASYGWRSAEGGEIQIRIGREGV